MSSSPGRRSLAWLAVGLVTLAALVAAPGAAAHATLRQTEPGNDTVVESPGEIVLRFSEPVETGLGAVRVLAAGGGRVGTGSLTRPTDSSVRVALPDHLPDGTYTVAWRVTSADSHPLHGAFVFHVGAPGASPAGVAAEVLAESETPRSISIAFTAVRFFSSALLLLAAGATAALALTLVSVSQGLRRRLLGVLAGVSAGLALASLTGIVLQGAEAAGVGVGDAARRGIVEGVLETRFGQAWLARAVLAFGLALLALAYRRRPGSGWLLDLGLVLCVGLIVTPAVAGHASTGGALSFVLDVVHVQAASIWIGGLAFLSLALLWAGADRWRLAASTVPLFSKVAAASVVALAGAGIVNGYLQIRTWSGLWETAYGRLVLVKAALLVPILVLAAWNHRRAVPRLEAGIASAAERRRFLRNVAAELGIVIAVVAVTAILVAEPPPRTAATGLGEPERLARTSQPTPIRVASSREIACSPASPATVTGPPKGAAWRSSTRQPGTSESELR